MTTTETFPTISYSTKETAALIRKALRAAFPGVKMSVTMSRGTGYGYMDISYTDGPTTAAVDAVTRRFRSESFDGMTDSTNTIPPTLYLVDGVPTLLAYSCRGASPSRHFSAEALAAAEVAVAADPGRYANSYDHDGSTYYACRKYLSQTDLS